MITWVKRVIGWVVRRKLTAIEKLILGTVEEALDADSRKIMELQIAMLQDVYRIDDGATVHLILSNSGSEGSLPNGGLFVPNGGDRQIAHLVVNYYKYLVEAELWVKDGVISRIDYPKPAKAGGRDGLWIISCEIKTLANAEQGVGG